MARRLQKRIDEATADGGPAGFVFGRSGFGPGGFSSSTVFIRGDVFDATSTEVRSDDQRGPDDHGDPWARELGSGR